MTSKKMVKGFMSAFALVCGGASFGADVTLTTVGNYTTMTTASNWSNGIAPTDQSQSQTLAGCDYFVVNKSSVQVPWYSAYEFYCNSMTWQNTSMIKRKTTMVFQNEGLKIVGISMDDWDDSPLSIGGPVTFLGNSVSSFHGARANSNHFLFTGAVSADATSGFYLYRSAAAENTYYGMTFTGDLSGFKGTMRLGDCARLELAGNTIPGAIEFVGTSGCRSVLVHKSGSAGLTFGSFAVQENSGAAVEFTANRDTDVCQSITVTDAFSMTGTMELKMVAETDTTGNRTARYKVVQAPAGTVLDETLFTFIPPAGANAEEYELSAEGNCLYVTHKGKIEVSREGEYLDLAESWSDKAVPHPDADYVSSISMNMRTPSLQDPWSFGGKSLSINTVNQTLVLQGWDITFPSLTLYKNLSMVNWHPGDKSTNTFCSGGTRFLRGNLALSGGSLQLSSKLSLYLIVDADISGADQFQLTTAEATDSKGALYIELAGDNSGFTGILNVMRATDLDDGLIILFRNANNLGGNPANYVYNAINIVSERISFRPLQTTALDNLNRGFDLFCPITFDTPADVTLTMKQVLRHRVATADVIKKGAGKLILADVPVFLSTKPAIRVTEGSFEAGSLTACEGYEIVFSGSGRLSVPSPSSASADIAKYGLKNTTAATPIAIDTDDGKLHIDASGLPEDTDVPFLTVSTAAAEAIRSKLVVDKPGRGLRGKVTEKVIDAGTVTFGVENSHTGFALLIR